MGKPVGIGIIGTGDISGQYFASFAKLKAAKLVAVADVDVERAQAKAAANGVEAASVEDLLADDRIDIVINLTPPAFHADVDKAVIAAGKHVHSEKPLATSLEAGLEVLRAADAAGVRVGCAPDTFVGTGLQTTLAALQGDRIGTPFAAAAQWGGPGPESWHPNPQFLFGRGGGPVLDIGPYYVTALVTHLGPVTKVMARSGNTDRVRHVGSGPLAGTKLDIEAPTFASALLEHASGAVSTVSLSFETWASKNSLLEIYGTGGTLHLPDPNWFSEVGQIFEAGAEQWVDLAPTAGFIQAGRGFGVAEMARAIELDRPHRVSGQLALHVVEILLAIDQAKPGTGVQTMTTTATPPALIPLLADPADE